MIYYNFLEIIFSSIDHLRVFFVVLYYFLFTLGAFQRFIKSRNQDGLSKMASV